jgi:hypothetical protein
MYKTFTSLLVSVPFSLTAMLGFFDMDVSFDPVNMKSRSHVDIAPQSAVSFWDKAWLLTPRFSIYLDGSFDVAIASGLRHTTSLGYLGHHSFWSVSQTKHGKFHQLGHSLDFLTPHWDFRLNYYHPVTKTQMDEWFLYSTHIWAESEVLWKGQHFNVGFGPRYNFTTNCWGAQSRFVIPFKYFNLGAIVGYDHGFLPTISISFSFSLYNSTRTSQLYDPVCHKSRVRYEKIELPIYNKAKEPKKESQENLGVVKEEPKPLEAIKSEVIDEPAPKEDVLSEVKQEATPIMVQPPEPTTTPPKSLWTLFFDGERQYQQP